MPRDCGDDSFSKVGVRYAEDCRLSARKQSVQRIFDFLRINIETAGNDEIFGTAQEFDADRLVYLRDVPVANQPSLVNASASVSGRRQ